MALQGNLETFRLEEILQLIATQRKTGVLKLGAGDRRAALVFEEGRVISTHEPGSRDPSSLEASLKRMGRLSSAQLGRLAELRGTDGSDPLDIILGSSLVPPEELAQFLEEHVQDLLLRVLSWRSGSYEFVNRTLSPAPTGFRLAFRTEGVLMEAMRRQDEMTRFRRVLQSPAALLSRQEMSVAREPDARRRRIVESLVTPRTLGDLEESLPLWLFELYEGLFELWESGAIEVQGAQERKARERMRRQLARTPVEQVAFGAGVAAAMAGAALLSRLLAAALLAPSPEAPVSAWEEARSAQYLDDVRLAAECYKLEHGSYPNRLERVPGWKTPPPGAPDPSVPSQLTAVLSDTALKP